MPWPEFQELDNTLVAYVGTVADRTLTLVVHPELAEAKEIDPPGGA
jgi:hypothetical protein